MGLRTECINRRGYTCRGDSRGVLEELAVCPINLNSHCREALMVSKVFAPKIKTFRLMNLLKTLRPFFLSLLSFRSFK